MQAGRDLLAGQGGGRRGQELDGFEHAVEVVVVLPAERHRVVGAESGDPVAAHHLFAEAGVTGAQNVLRILASGGRSLQSAAAPSRISAA